MRLVLRVLGTWLVGLALVLAVIDGTKSLAANAPVLTSLEQSWLGVHAASLAAVHGFITERYFASLLDGVLAALLGYPGFAVFGVLGFALLLIGRKPRRDRFVHQEEI